MALYRKYRPATFAEVVGQEHVTDPLRTALDTGRISHAYLFSGPRGCGKTSSARILARSLNCVDGPTSTPCGVCPSCVALGPGGPGNLDVIELDAASHGGVDDTRELRDRAFYAPAESRYRVFIVDEAHMVTTAGFNALLKIVEEPPAHLIFVFATTEPEKVLPTIRSRTHHYPFRLLPPATMRGLLGKICEQEAVPVEDAVYPLVIRAGGGSPRDSLSVLDQLLAGAGPEGVTYPRAVALLGVTDVALIDRAVHALADSDGAELFGVVEQVMEAGHDPRRFAVDLLERLRDLILVRAVPDATERGLVAGPADVLERLREQAGRIGPATLTRYAELLHEGLGEMRGATAPRLLLEVVCARMLLPAASDTEAATLQRLERLEQAMAGGVFAPAPSGAGATVAVAPDPVPVAGADQPPRRRGAEAMAALRRERSGAPAGPAAKAEPGEPVNAGAAVVGGGTRQAHEEAAPEAGPVGRTEPVGGAPHEEQPEAVDDVAAGHAGESGARASQGADLMPVEAAPAAGDREPLEASAVRASEGAREAPDAPVAAGAGAGAAEGESREAPDASPPVGQVAAAGAESLTASVPSPSVAGATAASPSVDRTAAGGAESQAAPVTSPAETRPNPGAPAAGPPVDRAAEDDAELPAAFDGAGAEEAAALATADDTPTPVAGAADAAQPAPSGPADVAESAPSGPAGAGAAPGGDSDADIQRVVTESWPEIRSRVREFGPTLQALLSGASVLRVERGVVVFAHQSPPLAQRLSDPRNVEAVRSAIRAVLNRELDLRWEAGGAPPPRQPAPARQQGRAERKPEKSAPRYSRPSQNREARREPGPDEQEGEPAWGPAARPEPKQPPRQAPSSGRTISPPAGRGTGAQPAPPSRTPYDDIPPPDYPDLPDDPGPDGSYPPDPAATSANVPNYRSGGAIPATTAEEEREMLAAAAEPVAPGDRRDPDELALELLRSELGATRLDG
ncbi:DNA polymerase III subunit gamma and tau [Nocardia sp. NPDC057353]|uniref:DNA polymerase III subunit gamma and tau n=1 Tax=Nocardia sp. NPDC057353 TaxID=3346104 RepID=UPI0036394233